MPMSHHRPYTKLKLADFAGIFPLLSQEYMSNPYLFIANEYSVTKCFQIPSTNYMHVITCIVCYNLQFIVQLRYSVLMSALISFTTISLTQHYHYYTVGNTQFRPSFLKPNTICNFTTVHHRMENYKFKLVNDFESPYSNIPSPH